jgi:hypothetical protein
MSAFDPTKHLDAMAPILGLSVEAAWRPDVLQFLAVAARMADLLNGFPPGEALEHAAPVFRPGEPEA